MKTVKGVLLIFIRIIFILFVGVFFWNGDFETGILVTTITLVVMWIFSWTYMKVYRLLHKWKCSEMVCVFYSSVISFLSFCGYIMILKWIRDSFPDLKGEIMLYCLCHSPICIWQLKRLFFPKKKTEEDEPVIELHTIPHMTKEEFAAVQEEYFKTHTLMDVPKRNSNNKTED